MPTDANWKITFQKQWAAVEWYTLALSPEDSLKVEINLSDAIEPESFAVKLLTYDDFEQISHKVVANDIRNDGKTIFIDFGIGYEQAIKMNLMWRNNGEKIVYVRDILMYSSDTIENVETIDAKNSAIVERLN